MSRFARSLAAFALGASVIAAGFALARGPEMALPGISQGGWLGSSGQEPVEETRAPDDQVRNTHRKHASGIGYRGVATGAVCVRLCDGFFFPAASAAEGDAGCASQCPGAPTEIYAMTSDRIDDAYAITTGAPYTRLPVAKRYQQSRESTCSCHRDGVASHIEELRHDNTLRKGDIVMTAEGFRVYEGSGWGPSKTQDFVSVGKAGLPRDESAQLASMEHANASRVAPAAPTVVAARPKGNVTVDNGMP